MFLDSFPLQNRISKYYENETQNSFKRSDLNDIICFNIVYQKLQQYVD